jgi:hypothetical protein
VKPREPRAPPGCLGVPGVCRGTSRYLGVPKHPWVPRRCVKPILLMWAVQDLQQLIHITYTIAHISSRIHNYTLSNTHTPANMNTSCCIQRHSNTTLHNSIAEFQQNTTRHDSRHTTHYTKRHDIHIQTHTRRASVASSQMASSASALRSSTA